MSQHFQPTKNIAEEHWKNARRKVIYQKVVCAVTHCSVDMRSFKEIRDRLHLNEKRYLGLQEIPLDQIQGSVGRYDDFTSTFLPRKDHMKQRWEKVDEMVSGGRIPPIEVYKVDQAYFVVDGNHRISAARQHGFESIQAHVTEFQSPFEEESASEMEARLIEAEKRDFINQVSGETEVAGDEIVFTCLGCYRDLSGQIETYRKGMEVKTGKPVSYQEAYSAWHQEVYGTAVKAIRQDNLLDLFPDRTEADLFIWAWRNGRELEGLDSAEGDSS